MRGRAEASAANGGGGGCARLAPVVGPGAIIGSHSTTAAGGMGTGRGLAAREAASVPEATARTGIRAARRTARGAGEGIARAGAPAEDGGRLDSRGPRARCRCTAPASASTSAASTGITPTRLAYALLAARSGHQTSHSPTCGQHRRSWGLDGAWSTTTTGSSDSGRTVFDHQSSTSPSSSHNPGSSASGGRSRVRSGSSRASRCRSRSDRAGSGTRDTTTPAGATLSARPADGESAEPP